MSLDLVIRRAGVAGSKDPLDIGFAGGRIAAMAPVLVCDAPEVDAAGRLATAGLVETHIHLDKAGIIGRCRLCEGTLAEAVRETARAKAAFTEEDVYARARAVVERAILHGTSRLRSYVEIDPRAGFRGFAALKRLRRDYAALIDIELCAFAQEGLTQEMATYAMLESALADGADSIGGCPYTDADPVAHVGLVFDLARRFDCRVDFHIDFDLDPTGSALPAVLAETERRGWGGRVSVGHATKFSAMPPDAARSLAGRLADAGIALVVLPATDLFLNGRQADRLVPRGMTPAHRYRDLGLTAALATNNVLNPFTPFGDASLMRMANLYANVAQAGTDGELEAAFAMITGDAARLLGATGYGLAVGAPADLVLFDAPSPAAAVAEIAPAIAGWKAGRPSFIRPAPRLFAPEAAGK